MFVGRRKGKIGNVVDRGNNGWIRICIWGFYRDRYKRKEKLKLLREGIRDSLVYVYIYI